jgi:hypothetical protein
MHIQHPTVNLVLKKQEQYKHCDAKAPNGKPQVSLVERVNCKYQLAPAPNCNKLEVLGAMTANIIQKCSV